MSDAASPAPAGSSADARISWMAESPAAQRVLKLADKVADAGTTLLIIGESGTGKDQLARWIHEQGLRHDAPFLKIDCASLPSELVESELFGHERGAFTGAVAQKPGRLEMARGGTIVLDEVAALAPGIQAKLLRVLEERVFERLGGTETLRMDSRLIALTNADLQRAVAAGRFREDLYFRLGVLVIQVPSLRERREDIRSLAVEFLELLRRDSRQSRSAFERCGRKFARKLHVAGKRARIEERDRARRHFRGRPRVAPGKFPVNSRSRARRPQPALRPALA